MLIIGVVLALAALVANGLVMARMNGYDD